MSLVNRTSVLFGHITNGNTYAAKEIIRKVDNVDLQDEVRAFKSIFDFTQKEEIN